MPEIQDAMLPVPGGDGLESFYAAKEADYFSQARTDIAPLLPQSFETVLEIGCGAGGTMRWLRTLRSVRHAIGFEMSATAAESARSAFDRVEVCDIEKTPLPQELFDLIIILDVLEHLVDPWSVVTRLREALTPGGTIIASIPNVGHYTVLIPLLRGQWEYQDMGLLDRTHLRFFTAGSATALMSPSGLKVDFVGTRTMFPLEGWLRSRRLRWYSKRIASFLFPQRFFVTQYLIRSVPA